MSVLGRAGSAASDQASSTSTSGAVPWSPPAAAQLTSVHDCARRLILGPWVFFAARFGGAVPARGVGRVADLACMHGNPEGLLCRRGAVSAALMSGRLRVHACACNWVWGFPRYDSGAKTTVISLRHTMMSIIGAAIVY